VVTEYLSFPYEIWFFIMVAVALHHLLWEQGFFIISYGHRSFYHRHYYCTSISVCQWKVRLLTQSDILSFIE
jgi:hypothetical protein